MLSAEEQAWLDSRACLSFLDAPLSPARLRAVVAGMSRPFFGVAVHPTQLPGLQLAEGKMIAAAVGYPSGRHHSLVKAAEARLAVAEGANHVWLSIDPVLSDPNALLADIIAVREAVPTPLQLGVILSLAEGGQLEKTQMEAARLAGADYLMVAGPALTAEAALSAASVPHLYLPSAGQPGHLRSVEEVIAELDAGAKFYVEAFPLSEASTVSTASTVCTATDTSG